MPLGLASTEGLGLAPGTTAWTCEGRSFRFPLGALPLRDGDGGVAGIRAAPTLDCLQTHQWQMRPNEAD